MEKPPLFSNETVPLKIPFPESFKLNEPFERPPITTSSTIFQFEISLLALKLNRVMVFWSKVNTTIIEIILFWLIYCLLFLFLDLLHYFLN